MLLYLSNQNQMATFHQHGSQSYCGLYPRHVEWEFSNPFAFLPLHSRMTSKGKVARSLQVEISTKFSQLITEYPNFKDTHQASQCPNINFLVPRLPFDKFGGSQRQRGNGGRIRIIRSDGYSIRMLWVRMISNNRLQPYLRPNLLFWPLKMKHLHHPTYHGAAGRPSNSAEH